jgi:hypothetical protein
MSSAEGKRMIEINETDFADASAAIQKWEQFPTSCISHHNAECCRLAREWMLSMDYSQLNAGNPLTGPRWLRLKFKWGPSSWPIYWCEAVEEKTLDCGALAALAQELFVARGVRCFPAQFIQQYTEQSARHWYKKWEGDESSVQWIKEDLIYHEGCAIVARDDEIKVWDPTASWWVNPKQFGGYGGVLVLRIFDSQSSSASQTGFKWGTHRIIPNQWQKILRARGDFA